MSEGKVVRVRDHKVYAITNKDTNERVFVKAKTRTAVSEHLINQMYDIEMIGPKHMGDFATAVQGGVEIHEI
jgi:hypothetical protein